MERKKSRASKYMLLFIAVLVTFLIIYAFLSFTKQNSSYAQKVIESRITELAYNSTKNITKEIENNFKLINVAAIDFEQESDLHSAESLKKLEAIQGKSEFRFMRLSNSEGTALDIQGESVQIAEREYFQEAMAGKSNLSDVLTALSDESRIFVFCAPIMQNGTVAGTINGVYDIEKLAEIAQNDILEKNGYALIFKKTGELILSDSNSMVAQGEGQNVLEWFEQSAFEDGDTYEALRSDIQNNRTGTISYRSGKERRSACYMPIGINDWYLLQVADSVLIEEHYLPINKSAFVLVVRVILYIVIVGLAGVFVTAEIKKSQLEDLTKLKLLADNIPGGVAELVFEDDFIIRYANDGFYALTGYSKEEYMGGFIQGHSTRIILEADLKQMEQDVMQALNENRPIHTEYRLKHKDGSLIWIGVDGSVLKRTKKGAVIQAIFMNITAQKNHTKALLENAKLDKMTGLYDKVSAQDTIENSLNKSEQGSMNAVIAIDIDDFKLINDTYGHQIGDEGIIALADMLKSYFRSTDIIGRIGGDEYVVFMRNVTESGYIEQKIQTFVENTSLLEIDGKKNMLACSAGAVIFCAGDIRSYAEVFAKADANLYQAKKAGKRQCVITGHKIEGGSL